MSYIPHKPTYMCHLELTELVVVQPGVVTLCTVGQYIYSSNSFLKHIIERAYITVVSIPITVMCAFFIWLWVVPEGYRAV